MVVDIKVGGPAGLKGTAATEKKKATVRPGSPSFASLLGDISSTSEVAAPVATGILPPVLAPLDDGSDEHPRNSREQAEGLLENLQKLAEDVLSGNPTAAAAKLEAYLKTEASDRATLSPEAQKVLDELSTRAAVAAEKARS